MGPIIWADGDPWGLSVAIGTLVAIVAGVVVASGGILLAWLNTGGRLVKRLDELTSQVFKAQNERLDCEKRHAATEMKLADALHDVSQYQRRIERLEAAAGLAAPSQTIPGLLIANLDGTIIEYSPALTAIIGWTSEEMVGRNIEKLVPPELLEAHRAGFAKAKTPDAVIDPGKKIHTYALDRNDRRVPVTISLKKWATGGFITATFRERPSGEAGAAARPDAPGRGPTTVENVMPGGKP